MVGCVTVLFSDFANIEALPAFFRNRGENSEVLEDSGESSIELSIDCFGDRVCGIEESFVYITSGLSEVVKVDWALEEVSAEFVCRGPLWKIPELFALREL